MVDRALPEYRQPGYASANAGRRFYVVPQTPTDVITGTVGFDETLPVFMLSNPANNIIIVRSLIVTNLTSKVVNVSVVLDSANRFSEGGTLMVPQNTDIGSTLTSGITAFRKNPIATASGAGTRVLRTDQIVGVPGKKSNMQFEDCIIMDGLSSLLVYVWDGMGELAPTVFGFLDFEAEPQQNPARKEWHRRIGRKAKKKMRKSA